MADDNKTGFGSVTLHYKTRRLTYHALGIGFRLCQSLQKELLTSHDSLTGSHVFMPETEDNCRKVQTRVYLAPPPRLYFW